MASDAAWDGRSSKSHNHTPCQPLVTFWDWCKAFFLKAQRASLNKNNWTVCLDWGRQAGSIWNSSSQMRLSLSILATDLSLRYSCCAFAVPVPMVRWRKGAWKRFHRRDSQLTLICSLEHSAAGSAPSLGQSSSRKKSLMPRLAVVKDERAYRRQPLRLSPATAQQVLIDTGRDGGCCCRSRRLKAACLLL